MEISSLHKDFGTYKDNRTSPIHDWYKFTAGFSYKLVDTIIKEEKLTSRDVVYECFAGCGTTLVSAQKNGIYAIGNEAQELLFDIIKAKLNWEVNTDHVFDTLRKIETEICLSKNNVAYHSLLKTLYTATNLFELYTIRDFISDQIKDESIALFLKLALTQTLHKVSLNPISVPYISRNKTLDNVDSAFYTFVSIVVKMLYDLEGMDCKYVKNNIFLHDSRNYNSHIPNNFCSISITSPPYLNNLDYGEVSKVCSHFFGITNNWNDITEKVRKKLVTGATTHYKENDFVLEQWKQRPFYVNNKKIVDGFLPSILNIKRESATRKGKKSFDILALYYFEDMYNVILEMRRVLKIGSKAYLVLGDSAPYGIFIDTIKILGEISKNCGFLDYEILKIRERGAKWKSLKYRHNLSLSESLLILK